MTANETRSPVKVVLQVLSAVTIAAALLGLPVANTSVEAKGGEPAGARMMECTGANYNSNMSASLEQLSHWAMTNAAGSACDSEVEGWITGSPYGADSDQQDGQATVNPQWSGQFCGTYDGRSNHWMIDSGGWHEVASWVLDQDWTGGGCGV